MIRQSLGAFIAVLTLSIVIGVPRKFIFYSGLIGFVGWFIYLFINELEFSTVFSYFVAALVVALLSHSFARIFKAPVTVFLIAGILPLVPGTILYRAVYSMIRNDSTLANYYLTQTLQIAGVIALAIFVMDSIFRIFQKK